MIFILILVILFTILPNYSQKIAAIVSILSMVCGTYLQYHISLKLTPLSVSVSLSLSERSFVSFFNFQISKYVYRVTDSEMNIRAEIKDLKSEQETISMTEEFAKYAKLQRKIDKHTAEVKRLGMCKHMQSNFVISN